MCIQLFPTVNFIVSLIKLAVMGFVDSYQTLQEVFMGLYNFDISKLYEIAVDETQVSSGTH